MDLRQLQAFLAVIEHGGFTAAARATHTVQSNISTHVARLERELDATLIDRATGVPTAEGEAVVARVRRIQNELTSLEADVSSLRGTPRGSVRLGIIGTTARWFTPLLVDRLAADMPEIKLVIVDGTNTSLVLRLLEGELDFAVLSLPVDDPELKSTPLFRESNEVIAPNSHPFATQTEPPSLSTLAKHELLLAAAGTAFRQEIDSAFHAAGLTPIPKIEIDGLRLLASLAFQGFGLAIVPATAAPGWVGGDWKRIMVPGLGHRTVGLAVRRRGMLSTAAQATIDVTGQIIAKNAPELPGVELVSKR